MGERFRRFMTGRYGVDTLGRFLMLAGMVFLVLYFFLPYPIFFLITIIIIVINYYRMFSRNISQRARENEVFTGFLSRLTGRTAPRSAADRNYRIFRCPSCRQKVRVPRGRGRIEITCPKCRTSFIRKS